MRGYYAKGRLVFSHRNLRFRADPVATPEGDDEIVPLADVN